jgi:hypothetical protein
MPCCRGSPYKASIRWLGHITCSIKEDRGKELTSGAARGLPGDEECFAANRRSSTEQSDVRVAFKDLKETRYGWGVSGNLIADTMLLSSGRV